MCVSLLGVHSLKSVTFLQGLYIVFVSSLKTDFAHAQKCWMSIQNHLSIVKGGINIFVSDQERHICYFYFISLKLRKVEFSY